MKAVTKGHSRWSSSLDHCSHSKCFGGKSTSRGSGCFAERVQEQVVPHALPDPIQSTSDLTHVIEYDDFWCNNLINTALHKRAWVLQERLLSPRTIHFGQEQTFWECRHAKACEGYPDGIPDSFTNSRTRSWRQGEQDTKSASPSSTHEQGLFSSLLSTISRSLGLPFGSPRFYRSLLFQSWYSTVERYRECNLSKPSDKLVAIAGIANKVHQITGERYLAGLWDNKHLLISLLWHVPAREQADSSPAVRFPGLGNSGYRAPSWSWASLDAAISWTFPCRCEQQLAIINKTEINHVSNSKSQIKSAEMLIKGALIQTSIKIVHQRQDGSFKEDGSYKLTLQETHNQREIMEPTIFLDKPLLPKFSIEAYLVPICTQLQDSDSFVLADLAGLILQFSPAPNAYERIGIFHFSADHAQVLGQKRGRKWHHSSGLLEQVIKFI